jgi:H+/Cl- antiporter ClcA
MRRLRELLREEYIGAITIGFVLAQSVLLTAGTILRPIDFYLFDRGRQRSAFGSSPYPWNSLVTPVLTIVLQVLVAFALLWWLYMRPEAKTFDDDVKSDIADEAQEN